MAAADPGALPLRVALIWGPAPGDRQTVTIDSLGSDYRTVPLAFTAGASSETARLEITSGGLEAFRVGTVSLMPADNVEGFRPEVLAALRELNSPVYRWPGGNFVSGYDWRDGVGDRDKRPAAQEPGLVGRGAHGRRHPRIHALLRNSATLCLGGLEIMPCSAPAKGVGSCTSVSCEGCSSNGVY